MAFCEKCGREIGPSGVCESCQKAEEQTALPVSRTASRTVVTKAKSGLKAKKPFVWIASASAAVAVIAIIVVIAWVVLSGGIGYKKPVKKLVKLINNQSTDVLGYSELLMDPLFSDFLMDSYKILKKDKSFKNDFNKSIDNLKSFYSDNFEDFKITKYEFLNVVKMDEEDLGEINEVFKNKADGAKELTDGLKALDKNDYEELADDLGLDKSTVKNYVKCMIALCGGYDGLEALAGYEVTLRFYGECDGNTDKTGKIKNVRIIKVDRTWYIYDDIFSRMTFSDDLSDISLNGAYLNIFAPLRKIDVYASKITDYIN